MREVLKYGIDVSNHQGKIDWSKVKASGKVDFAFIRVGFRGYKSGDLNEDEQFKANIDGASKNGIMIGAYFFSTAKNEAEAIEEADFVLNRIKDYNVELPIMYDLEKYGNPAYRTFGISKAQRTANYNAFTDRVKSNGYKGLIYGSKAFVRSKFDINSINDYIWLAAYPKTPDLANPVSIGAYDNRVAIWQYSSKGKIDGIKANVDLNAMYIDVSNKKEPNPYTMPTTTLYLGNTKMTAEDVKWLQWELAEDGYDITADGIFTKTTQAVLRDYQYNHNLEVDGKCGSLTKADMAKR